MIKDSEQESQQGNNSVINLEEESDEERQPLPSNNQMTLRHDEEFPMRNLEMDQDTENLHHEEVTEQEDVVNHVSDTPDT